MAVHCRAVELALAVRVAGASQQHDRRQRPRRRDAPLQPADQRVARRLPALPLGNHPTLRTRARRQPVRATSGDFANCCSAPDSGAEYCDERARARVRARVCVCLSVRDHTFGTTRLIFTEFFYACYP